MLAVAIITIGATAYGQKGQVVNTDSATQSITYDGIDVSSYQKDIDWTTTAKDKNIKFVYVKATEGATHTSRHYRINIDNARKQGVKVGSYHFLRTTSRIRDQFANFTRSVKKGEQDLIPLLDVETMRGWTSEQLCDSVQLFADLIEQYYGCRPLIYTSSSFFNKHLAGRFSDYPLFIARYAKSEPRLTGGVKWILWQFSDCGRIKGIDADVDLCRFNKGCGMDDILMSKNKSNGIPERKKKEQEKTEVPPPPEKKPVEAMPVPAPVTDPSKMTKQERKAWEEQKKRQEEAEKRLREEEKKRAKEEAKKQAELEKQMKEEAKRQEKLRKQQEKEAKEQAEKARKDSLEQARKREKEARVSKAFQNTTTTRRNQQSADNDDIFYPTRSRKK